MASYKEAIEWIACNDDCYWIADWAEMKSMSVTASLVRDLWKKEDEKIVADITKMLRKVYPNHEALSAICALSAVPPPPVKS